MKSLLGAGGYGQVWQACDSRCQNRLVAVKVLDPPQGRPRNSATAGHSSNTASKTSHHDELSVESAALQAVRGLPHCLQLLNELVSPQLQAPAEAPPSPLPPGVRAMVMELAASDLLAVMIGVTSLVRQLAAPPGLAEGLLPLIPMDAPLRNQTPPTPAWHEGFARHFLLQAIAGLQAAASAGVYHRDVKLENFLIGPSGQLLLADFGLAHIASPNPTPQHGAAKGEHPVLSTYCCGTSMYKAPEMLSDSLLQQQLGLWVPPKRGKTGRPLHPHGHTSSSSRSSYCTAPLEGYDVCKVDTWSLGIVFLQLASGGVPPWAQTGARMQTLGGAFYNFTKQPQSLFSVFRTPSTPPKVDGRSALSEMGRSTLLHLLQVSPAARPSVAQLSPDGMAQGVHDGIRTYLDASTGRLGDDAVLQHLLAILPAVQQAARFTLSEVQRQRAQRNQQRAARGTEQGTHAGAHGQAVGPAHGSPAASGASNPPERPFSPVTLTHSAAGTAGTSSLPSATLEATVIHGAAAGAAGSVPGASQWRAADTPPLQVPANVQPPGAALTPADGYVGHSGRDPFDGTASGNISPLTPPPQGGPTSTGLGPATRQPVGPSSTTATPPPGSQASRQSLMHPTKAPPSFPMPGPGEAAAGGGSPPLPPPAAQAKAGQLDVNLIEKVLEEGENLNEPPPSGSLRAPVYARQAPMNPLQQLVGAPTPAPLKVRPPQPHALDFIPQGGFTLRLAETASPQTVLAPIAESIMGYLGGCTLDLKLPQLGGAAAAQDTAPVNVQVRRSSSAPLLDIPWAREGNMATSAVSVTLCPSAVAAVCSAVLQAGVAGGVRALLLDMPAPVARFEASWVIQAQEVAPLDTPWEGGGAGVLLSCAPCASIMRKAPTAQGSDVAALRCSSSSGRAFGVLAALAADAAASSCDAVGLSAALVREVEEAVAKAAGGGGDCPPATLAAAAAAAATAALQAWLQQGGAVQLAQLAWQQAVLRALPGAPAALLDALSGGDTVMQLLAKHEGGGIPLPVPLYQQVHEVVPVLFQAAAAPPAPPVPIPAAGSAAAAEQMQEATAPPQGMLRLGSGDSYSELM